MKRNRIKLIYKGPIEDIDHDLVYQESFARMTPQEKLETSWQMVVHYWKLRGIEEDELRLDRTVAIIKRA